MKVKVIEDRCISCGACQAICDEVFEVDDVSHVIKENIPENLNDNVIEAIESCPTEAIVKED